MISTKIMLSNTISSLLPIILLDIIIFEISIYVYNISNEKQDRELQVPPACSFLKAGGRGCASQLSFIIIFIFYNLDHI